MDSKGSSLWAAVVRSTAIFTPSPPGSGQGVGRLCMELTIKDDKIDLRAINCPAIDNHIPALYNKIEK